MATLATYSPEDVIVLIAGIVELNGFVDGTFISIEKDIPFFTKKESADGKMSRVFRPSTSYTVKLNLANTSASNDVLSVLSTADQLTQMAKFPMIIKDLNGSSLFFSTSCWIQSSPSIDFDTNISTRQWTIVAHGASMFTGGNNDPSELLQDVLGAAGGLTAGNDLFMQDINNYE